MDASNLPGPTTSPSGGGNSAHMSAASTLDTNALQAAYLAIQMQNQLQQQSQQQATAVAAAFPLLAALPPGAVSEAERLLANATLANVHISPSIVSAFQNSPTATTQRVISPQRQTSAFSPIRAIGNPITSTAPSRPQYAPPLDMMLLQMQMAAAAAGLVQSPFNLLSSTSTLDLLASHLPVQQQPQVSGLGTLATLAPNTAAASLAQIAHNSAVTSQTTLVAQSPCTTTCENSMLADRASSSLPGSPTNCNENSTCPLPRCYSMGKRQKESLKRPYTDMAVLRSLCDDVDTPDSTPTVKRRAKADENEQHRRLLAAEVMASIGFKGSHPSHTDNNHHSVESATFASLNQHLPNKEQSNSGEELSLSHPKTTAAPTTSSGCLPQTPTGDPNSPNRHHPFNHRPPAMEARFLECMAAIALHSNFCLPTRTLSSDIGDEGSKSQSSDSDKPQTNDDTTTEIETEGMTKPASPMDTCVNNDNDDVIVIDDAPMQEENSVSQDAKKDHIDELTERLMHKAERRTWPTTAIDDELCQELENYKGTDVPIIHAYVIPPRSDTSSSSGDTPDERGESPPFHSVPSLAVPLPILNILLERILHTMLQT
uniref:POU domain protein n=1 Tax=Ascaris lumbricoides TaxID=6252 RepID=A0A0M3I0A0_ASCLU